MEISNVVQLIDRVVKGASGEAKISDLKVGDLIKATVLSIDRSNMLIDIGGGKRLMATDQSQIRYNIGDKVLFEVVDKKSDIAVLKNRLSNDQILDSKLKSIGMDTKGNSDLKEGIKLLIDNEMPLSKGNIEALHTKKHVQTLANLVAEDILIDKENVESGKSLILDSDIREGVKQLLKLEMSNGKEISSLKTFEGLDKQLSNFNMKDLVFLLKNDVPLNMSKIVSHINLTKGNNKISSQLISLEKAVDVLLEKGIEDNKANIDASPKEMVQNGEKKELKGALNKFKNELNSLKTKIQDNGTKDIKRNVSEFKELVDKLDDIKRTHNIPSNTDISKALDDIKMSTDFMNTFNENGAYLQIPISTNGDIKDVELFISKNKKDDKKIDEENCNIYISLDTYNIGRINTLIEIKGRVVDLSFTTVDNRVKGLLKSKEAIIAKRIKGLGLDIGIIKYRIDSEEQSVVNESIMNSTRLNNIDIRV